MQEPTALHLAPEVAAGRAFRCVLDALAVLAEVDDAAASEAACALQRILGVHFAGEVTGEVTPALLEKARAAALAVHADAHAAAAGAAEDSAALYQQIAGDREREIEASRARHPARPTCLTEEEVAASLLAEARAALEAANHWRRAADACEPREAAGPLRVRAAQARARARRAGAAAGPWFRSAAAGHLAGGDRLQASRALEGALKAAALVADATAPVET